MIIHNQVSCENGFLPSVKTRPLIHSKPKNSSSQKHKRTIKYKLSITQENEIQQDVPYLIQDYYRRFKMQTHKCSPLSVSINFKSVSQEQIESRNSKVKEQKIKISCTKNKCKSLSQDSYTIKLQKKNAEVFQKINLSAKTILHRLKSFPVSQATNLGQLIKNSQNKLLQKTNSFENYEKTLQNNLSKVQSMQFGNDQKSTKGFLPRGQEFIQKAPNQNQMSSFQKIALRKKCRNPFKTIQIINSSQVDKNITPWLNQSKNLDQNPQQSIVLLQKSLQL